MGGALENTLKSIEWAIQDTEQEGVQVVAVLVHDGTYELLSKAGKVGSLFGKPVRRAGQPGLGFTLATA